MSDAILITAHGAVADGRVCTGAIQAAIDAASVRGGGRVVVPPGVFVTGTILLRSRITLDLQAGAVLLGSPAIADYPAHGERDGDRHGRHLLLAVDAEDVAITGGGAIDGNGPAFWQPQADPLSWITPREPRPSPMLDLVRCRNLRLGDITLRNSAGWTCHLLDCDGVAIRGVVIDNPLFGPNCDGFDLSGCWDVTISDCRISTCDDAIVLKTPRDSRDIRRVTVTNCVIRTACAALKLGAGESFHDMRQIVFSNCVVWGSNRAIALYSLEGATYEDIAISNVVCDTNAGIAFNRPLHIDLRRRTPQSRLGAIRRVTVSGLRARSDGRLLLTAGDGAQLEDIVLRDIVMTYPGIEDPAAADGATSGQFSNRTPEARRACAALVVDGVRDLVVENLRATWPSVRRDADWYSGTRIENGGARRFGPIGESEPPPFHLVWGRNLDRARFACPFASGSRPGVAPFAVEGRDIRIVD